jgi:hypothetical protein
VRGCTSLFSRSDGRTPLEFLSTEEGAREVENLLGVIEPRDFS